MVQRASTDMSIRDILSEVSPTARTRPAEATGFTMVAGFETWGRTKICVRRSCTTCLACMTSIPLSKMRLSDAMPGIDTERI